MYFESLSLVVNSFARFTEPPVSFYLYIQKKHKTCSDDQSVGQERTFVDLVLTNKITKMLVK